MFTGIVTELGRLTAMEPSGEDQRMTFEVEGDGLAGAREGDSMSVSGACLTMLDLGDRVFSADVSTETLDKTRLGLAPSLTGSAAAGPHPVSAFVVVEPRATKGAGAQHPALPTGSVPKSVVQTPVSGRSSSTRDAASVSPASALTTERACSYPVIIRNVGARP